MTLQPFRIEQFFLATMLCLPLVPFSFAVSSVASSAAETQLSEQDRPAASSIERPGSVPAAVRKFRFVYGATVDQLKPGTKARVWLPVAVNNHEQTVKRTSTNVPGNFRITGDKKYGNKVLYFEAKADAQGQIPIHIEYRVARKEAIGAEGEATVAADRPKFLEAAQLVPVNGKALSQLFGDTKPMGKSSHIARSLYAAVDRRMRYDKPSGKPWGRGDALWACQSGYGNCTDFHSLFIAACRDSGIPAKFEIGFPIPLHRGKGIVGGYHCWAKYDESGHWVPVDISEADKHSYLRDYYFGNLTADRLTFSVGRDLELSPPQEAGPVNFLVYPYVEVAGKQHRQFIKQFKYEDLR